MGVTRDPAALIERDLLMVELDLRGIPRARIARALGVDRSTVTRRLAAVPAAVRAELRAQLDGPPAAFLADAAKDRARRLLAASRCVAGRENITGRMRRNGLFYKTLRDQKRG
jgi:hypothetical protein